MIFVATISDKQVLRSMNRLIHPSAWRDCMKKGRRVLVRYSSTHEKTLPNRSILCPMELYRTGDEVFARVVDRVLRSRGGLLLAPFDQFPVLELSSGPHQRHQVSASEPSPPPLRRLHQLEDHRQARLPRARPLGDVGPRTDRREHRLYGVGRA